MVTTAVTMFHVSADALLEHLYSHFLPTCMTFRAGFLMVTTEDHTCVMCVEMATYGLHHNTET